MAIAADGQVIGCLNLTWRTSVLTEAQVAERYLGDVQTAVRSIEKLAAAASRVS